MDETMFRPGDQVRVKAGNVCAGFTATVKVVFTGHAGGVFIHLEQPHALTDDVRATTKPDPGAYGEPAEEW